MNELKEYLGYNPHVQTVYFDQHGNWFLHKGRTVVSEKSRAEILGGKSKPEVTPEPEGEVETPKPEHKKKK